MSKIFKEANDELKKLKESLLEVKKNELLKEEKLKFSKLLKESLEDDDEMEDETMDDTDFDNEIEAPEMPEDELEMDGDDFSNFDDMDFDTEDDESDVDMDENMSLSLSNKHGKNAKPAQMESKKTKKARVLYEEIDMTKASDDELLEMYDSMDENDELDFGDESMEGEDTFMDEGEGVDLDSLLKEDDMEDEELFLDDESENKPFDEATMWQHESESMEDTNYDEMDDEQLVEKILQEIEQTPVYKGIEEDFGGEDEFGDDMGESDPEMGFEPELDDVDDMDSELGEGELTIDKEGDETIITHEDEDDDMEGMQMENKKLKKELKSLKEQFNYLKLFSTNLVLTNKLFAEQSLTKEQKLQIAEKFDSSKSIQESQNIFKKIVNEQKANKNSKVESIKESISKLKEVKTDSQKTKIIETKLNPQHARSLELMRKLMK